MNRVAVDAGPNRIESDVETLALSALLHATDVAINRYRIPPGSDLPGGLHAHPDQEEVFVPIEGEATFETFVPGDGETPTESGEVTVGSGEAIRFAPGEFQSGRNDSDADLVVLAIGAPGDSEDVRIPIACPECDHTDVRIDSGADGVTFACPECGAERVPRGCPECGHDDLRVTLGGRIGTEPVVVCSDCSVEFETPPVRSRW